MRDRATVLTELARAVAQQRRHASLPERLCHAAVDILGARGGSLTIAYTEPHRVTLCSTDDEAARLEDLQDVLGQGPGPTAYTTGRQVRVAIGQPGSIGDARWPELDAALRDAFERLWITAIPIQPHGDVLGVLTCHSPVDEPAAIEEDTAQFLADAIGVALLKDSQQLTTDMGGPWASRAKVHQATGMVVAQLHISPDEALALLRAHAFAQTWPLARVAAAVLDRELDFTRADHATDRANSPEGPDTTEQSDGTQQP